MCAELGVLGEGGWTLGHRPGSLSSTTGLLGIQTNHSISLDPGFLLLKEDDPQTVIHLILG